MTLEEKYLAVINFCVERPYAHAPNEIAKRFRLRRETVNWLCDLLMLEMHGRREKNEKIELSIFIRDNPNLTAKEVMEITGKCQTKVYMAANLISHRFENSYSKRRTKYRTQIKNTEELI